MYLFFDTETTGVPKDYKAPVTDSNNWPRLVSLAWILANERGGIEEHQESIIIPVGFTIPDQAAQIHGITTERAKKEGIPITTALGRFIYLLQTEPIEAIVAHNISFDERIIRAEFHRLGWIDHLEKKERICTMLKSVQHCKLEKKPGTTGGYKWPKLQELHKKLFNQEFEGAHGAAADVLATTRCFFELKRLDVIK